jgi:hypothetical protein
MRGRMAKTTVRFTSFPRTEPPPQFVAGIVMAFQTCEESVCSERLAKGLTRASDGSRLLPRLEVVVDQDVCHQLHNRLLNVPVRTRHIGR